MNLPLAVRQISLIDRVDKIYRDTVWAAADRSSDHGQNLGAMGFVIKKILVHNEHTAVARGQEHYNMVTSSWDVRHLLEVGPSREGGGLMGSCPVTGCCGSWIR